MAALVSSNQFDAAEVSAVLRALANERRLMIVCRLVELGEASVASLAAAVGLSQSALSQHLAKMRAQRLVAYRRDGQTLWYRIADPRIEQLLVTVHRLFCPAGKPRSLGGPVALGRSR